MNILPVNSNISIPIKIAVKETGLTIEEDAQAVCDSNGKKTDYEEFVMKPEEIQDFFFMMIGKENPAKAEKGEKINLLA